MEISRLVFLIVVLLTHQLALRSTGQDFDENEIPNDDDYDVDYAEYGMDNGNGGNSAPPATNLGENKNPKNDEYDIDYVEYDEESVDYKDGTTPLLSKSSTTPFPRALRSNKNLKDNDYVVDYAEYDEDVDRKSGTTPPAIAFGGNNNLEEDYNNVDYADYTEYKRDNNDNNVGTTPPSVDFSATNNSEYDGDDSVYNGKDGGNKFSTTTPAVDLGGNNNPKDDEYDHVKGDDKKSSKQSPSVENSCVCIPYYQCKDGKIVSNGGGIMDPRRMSNPHEVSLSKRSDPPECSSFHVCCNLDSETVPSLTVKPYEHKCGVRNPGGVGSALSSQRVNGETEFGEWPWQAAVLKDNEGDYIFKCGGVLIDKYHIITVAHCVYPLYKNNDPITVRLGEWETSELTESLPHVDYKVSKFIIHPEYDNSSLWNDIAILRLKAPVVFQPHIDTVCLPQPGEIFNGETCIVTGWGKDAYKGGTYSSVLKEVDLEVISDFECQKMLRKTRLGKYFKLHKGFLCAGGESGLDSCKGDGGGPLVCYHRQDNSYALAGIVAWGIDCGHPGIPGVYMKIEKYLDWISLSTGVPLQDYWRKQ